MSLNKRVLLQKTMKTSVLGNRDPLRIFAEENDVEAARWTEL